MRISDWSSDVCSSDLIPGQIMTEKQPGHANPRQIIVRWLGIVDQILRLYALLAHDIRRAHSDKATEFFEPSPVEHIILARRVGAPILLLAVLAPHDTLAFELDPLPPGHLNSSHILPPLHFPHLPHLTPFLLFPPPPP